MLTEHKGELIFIGFSMVLYLIMAAFDASQKFVYLAVLFGLFGLVIAWKLFESVDDEPAGNEKMTEIADAIHEGTMVFLAREYKILGYFVAAIFLLLLILITVQSGFWMGLWTAVSYAVGAGCSMLAVYFGMNAATTAGVRTSQAALEGGQTKALNTVRDHTTEDHDSNHAATEPVQVAVTAPLTERRSADADIGPSRRHQPSLTSTLDRVRLLCDTPKRKHTSRRIELCEENVNPRSQNLPVVSRIDRFLAFQHSAPPQLGDHRGSTNTCNCGCNRPRARCRPSAAPPGGGAHRPACDGAVSARCWLGKPHLGGE